MNGRLGRLWAALLIVSATSPAAASTGTFQAIVREVTDDGFRCEVIYSAGADETSIYRFTWKNLKPGAKFSIDGKEADQASIAKAVRPGQRIQFILSRGRPANVDIYTVANLPVEGPATSGDGLLVLRLGQAVSVAKWVGKGMQKQIADGEIKRPRDLRALELRIDPSTGAAVAWTPPPGVANRALSVKLSDLKVDAGAVSCIVAATNYPLFPDEPQEPTQYRFQVTAKIVEGTIEGTWSGGERSGEVTGRRIAHPKIASPSVLWLHAEKGFSHVKGPKRNTLAVPVADGKGLAEGAEMIHYKGIYDGTVDAVDLKVDGETFRGSFTYTQAGATFRVRLDGVTVGTYAQGEFVTTGADGKEVLRGTCIGRLWPRHPIKKAFGWQARR